MLFEKGDKVLFIGDSISDYDRKRPVGEGGNNAWGTSYVAQAGSLLCCMYPELQLRIVNMGISGNRVRDLQERWQQDVMDQQPQWVVMFIGINDVWRQFDSPLQPDEHVLPDEYYATYEQLIQQTLPNVKGMVLLTPYFMEPNKADAMRARMDEYGAMVKTLGSKHHIPVIDTQAAWDDLFQHMHPCNIAWDRIHPNQVGNMYLAKIFLKEIGFER